jgi:hypothetical protein
MRATVALGASPNTSSGRASRVGPRGAEELDAGVLQQARGGGARAIPEHLERSFFGCDQKHLGAGVGAGRHQRELVERQRPSRERRDDEPDAARFAALDGLEQPGHGGSGTGLAECDGVVEDRQSAGA